MTTLGTLPLEDPDQIALFGNEWTALGKPVADRFRDACQRVAAAHDGFIDPSLVRAEFLDDDGHLTVSPRQYSGLWAAACGKNGYLRKLDRLVPITGPGSQGNGNKQVCLRQWIGNPDTAKAAS